MYSKELTEIAFELYLYGKPLSEISVKTQIPLRTLRYIKQRQKWDERKRSAIHQALYLVEQLPYEAQTLKRQCLQVQRLIDIAVNNIRLTVEKGKLPRGRQVNALFKMTLRQTKLIMSLHKIESKKPI